MESIYSLDFVSQIAVFFWIKSISIAVCSFFWLPRLDIFRIEVQKFGYEVRNVKEWIDGMKKTAEGDNKSNWEYRWAKRRCKTTTKDKFLNWRKSNREMIAKKQCDPRSTVPFRRGNRIFLFAYSKIYKGNFGSVGVWSRAFIPHGAESTSFSAWPNFGGKNWNAGNAQWPPTLGFGA